MADVHILVWISSSGMTSSIANKGYLNREKAEEIRDNANKNRKVVQRLMGGHWAIKTVEVPDLEVCRIVEDEKDEEENDDV